MPPIRRYLRVSKYTVLECRIYLDNPSDSRWLLDGQHPVLPRIFTAIRPLVPAKLREENERLFSRKKGKPVKDVIAEDDFEVSLFLRESRTRYSLLTRYKQFGDSGEMMMTDPLTKDGCPAAATAETGIVIEESDTEDQDLRHIPEARSDADDDDDDDDDVPAKRPREVDAEDQDRLSGTRAAKRRRDDDDDDNDDDDDKKMHFKTNYEGFNMFGWVLCLLVTRKGDKAGVQAASAEPPNQALMEEWISTQAQGDLDED
ncbi:hypothetical protein FE257_001883 [Aspergillus nanangensis]|uniref:Uncharacterized protein n=1 Tax=Aspergillus nanangensis TaxID=2582783 RepID=A0AAD4GPC6_ASPNN|nr:hypothetical protein FE257_001883 [Aspergillus nanangensis]